MGACISKTLKPPNHSNRRRARRQSSVTNIYKQPTPIGHIQSDMAQLPYPVFSSPPKKDAVQQQPRLDNSATYSRGPHPPQPSKRITKRRQKPDYIPPQIPKITIKQIQESIVSSEQKKDAVQQQPRLDNSATYSRGRHPPQPSKRITKRRQKPDYIPPKLTRAKSTIAELQIQISPPANAVKQQPRPDTPAACSDGLLPKKTTQPITPTRSHFIKKKSPLCVDIHTDTESFNSDTESFNSDTESFNSDTESFNSDTESFNSDTESFNSDTESLNSDTDTNTESTIKQKTYIPMSAQVFINKLQQEIESYNSEQVSTDSNQLKTLSSQIQEQNQHFIDTLQQYYKYRKNHSHSTTQIKENRRETTRQLRKYKKQTIDQFRKKCEATSTMIHKDFLSSYPHNYQDETFVDRVKNLQSKSLHIYEKNLINPLLAQALDLAKNLEPKHRSKEYYELSKLHTSVLKPCLDDLECQSEPGNPALGRGVKDTYEEIDRFKALTKKYQAECKDLQDKINKQLVYIKKKSPRREILNEAGSLLEELSTQSLRNVQLIEKLGRTLSLYQQAKEHYDKSCKLINPTQRPIKPDQVLTVVKCATKILGKSGTKSKSPFGVGGHHKKVGHSGSSSSNNRWNIKKHRWNIKKPGKRR